MYAKIGPPLSKWIRSVTETVRPPNGLIGSTTTEMKG